MLPVKRRFSVYMHSLGTEAIEVYMRSVCVVRLLAIDARQASLRFCGGLILGWPSLGPMEGGLCAASE